MKNKSDFLNFIFILVSIVLAIFIPFKLFLFSYAFLGPLHYLTEINWLNKNRFFSSSHFPIYFILIVMTLISLVSLNSHFNFFQFSFKSISIVSITTYFVLFSFISILLFEILKNKIKLNSYIGFLVFIVSVILCVLILRGNYLMHLTTFVFVPTLIHVFVFTFFFMWLGYLKNPNLYSLLAIAFMIFIPLLILLLPSNFLLNYSSTLGNETYIKSGFVLLNKTFLGLIDQEYIQNNDFYVSDKGLKIQTFIAFAYTYHYLNWFAKINIIGWAKSITKKNLSIIFIAWVFAIGLYIYDFKLGLIVLFFMSLGHVLLEFPLNIIVMKSIFKHYRFRVAKIFNSLIKTS